MFGTKCPEVVKAGERHKAAPRQIIGSPQPPAFSAARTAAGAVKSYAQISLQILAE